jgi:hypothetical protein
VPFCTVSREFRWYCLAVILDGSGASDVFKMRGGPRLRHKISRHIPGTNSHEIRFWGMALASFFVAGSNHIEARRAPQNCCEPGDRGCRGQYVLWKVDGDYCGCRSRGPMTISETKRARPDCLRHSCQERFRGLVRDVGVMCQRAEIRWSPRQGTSSRGRWRIPTAAVNSELLILESL